MLKRAVWRGRLEKWRFETIRKSLKRRIAGEGKVELGNDSLRREEWDDAVDEE